MKTHTRSAAILTAALGAAALLTLSGCDALDTSKVKEASYANASEMQQGTIELQNWIPREATDVKFKYSTMVDRSPITTFKASAASLQCESGATTVEGTNYAPQLEADWMPKDAASRATLQCGSFFYYADGDRIIAWDAAKPDYDNPENKMTQTPVPAKP
ncbi:hypothetical protein [Haematomicrobium sanguinis]|uniref:hypothetical protein n=1 Tax=Haematomicrobium sanguinis TaxID=479106 RepID=UPI00047A6779|nr:hypothetical protein [Haematomicrobium sanguinis]